MQEIEVGQRVKALDETGRVGVVIEVENDGIRPSRARVHWDSGQKLYTTTRFSRLHIIQEYSTFSK